MNTSEIKQTRSKVPEETTTVIGGGIVHIKIDGNWVKGVSEKDHNEKVILDAVEYLKSQSDKYMGSSLWQAGHTMAINDLIEYAKTLKSNINIEATNTPKT